MEGEDGPLKLQSSSKDNLLIPWTTLGRCGKPKERSVPSYEALGLQNLNSYAMVTPMWNQSMGKE